MVNTPIQQYVRIISYRQQYSSMQYTNSRVFSVCLGGRNYSLATWFSTHRRPYDAQRSTTPTQSRITCSETTACSASESPLTFPSPILHEISTVAALDIIVAACALHSFRACSVIHGPKGSSVRAQTDRRVLRIAVDRGARICQSCSAVRT